MSFNPTKTKQLLWGCEYRKLFIEELGWDKASVPLEIPLGDRTYRFEPVAHKRGLQVFQCNVPSGSGFPDYQTRRKIERQVAKSYYEHILIFADANKTRQTWQWVRREANSPLRCREVTVTAGQDGESLVQRLQHLSIDLAEEESLTLMDVNRRTRQAFDLERVTKRFYEKFKAEHTAFLGFIKGIDGKADREWYASLMLNRLMFVYFIQKKRFLNNDPDYLRTKLKEIQTTRGRDQFASFYRHFLLRLFHEGLGKKKKERKAEFDKLLGEVPYLNGGLFDEHELERDNKEIQVPDEAFTRLFDFFEQYQWHLDERPAREDNEINPDVLGYIFEKYVNQKQMGAYYTKEDITGYIARNTVLPFILAEAEKNCAVAFQPGGSVWKLLKDDPDRYIHEPLRQGVGLDLPSNVAAGANNVAKRGEWNKVAVEGYGLPTETWREYMGRRRRCEELRTKLREGQVASVADLITLNLDIARFVADVIVECEGPELLRAIYQAVVKVSVLDPTCGSGAFLFAALNVLEPLYDACLERMQVFVDEAERVGAANGNERYTDFREHLKQLALHPNRRYFILKSVIINNLYGVDVMDEAVEICKLRLFLKLVAQVDKTNQLEPLPDIDFNIRAGNTLVGFATLDEIRQAVQGQIDFTGEMSRILADIQKADEQFKIFRRLQAEFGPDAVDFRSSKQVLRTQLSCLREQLDRFLASVYGVDPDHEGKFRAWHDSHKPFNWFAEFYGIMNAGGFDIIIGNPPYIQISEIKSYQPRGYTCLSCGNLYAVVLERCSRLANRTGRQGYIVPVSSISTEGYADLQKVLLSRSLCYSSYDDRPSRLFDGLEHIRLTIHLIGGLAAKPTLASTQYHKWSKDERGALFHKLGYTPAFAGMVPGAFPKLSHQIEAGILTKLSNQQHRLSEYLTKTGGGRIYYSRKVGYFLQVLDFAPEVRDGKNELRDPSEFKELRFTSKDQAQAALCCLNANLFYWFVTVFSDCRHLNKREVDYFPVDLQRLSKDVVNTDLTRLAKELMKSLKDNSERRTQRYGHDTLTIQCIIPKHSKAIIDAIDRALAKFYGFTDEELDFILNYDIKYRLGITDAAIQDEEA